MSHQDHQLRSVSDPRLALHAASAWPAWLFVPDGSRVLWANPVGVRAFGAASSAALALRTFESADARRRQIAQLARSLPESGVVRLERLRGFGASLGARVTCRCARLAFSDGSHGILVAPLDGGGRTMPLPERLQRLVEGINGPLAAFGRDGILVSASDAARKLFGFRDLRAAGLEAARKDALASGRAEASLGSAHLILQRVGAGADIGLVAFFASGAMPDAEAAATVAAAAQMQPSFSVPAIEEVLVTPPEPSAPETSAPAALSEVSPDTAQDATAPLRRHPLRFGWHLDPDGMFSLAAGEFARLIGPQAASSLHGLWQDLAQAFDPDGRVAGAIATRETWSGITLGWPLGGEQVAIELSGLPTYDEARNFVGYRGLGVCRDLDALARLAALRDAHGGDHEPVPPQDSPATPSPDPERSRAADQPPDGDLAAAEIAGSRAPIDMAPPEPNSPEPIVEPPRNVVPFRPPGDAKAPVLTPVENNAFDELARQLSERLENGNGEALRPAEPAANQHPPAEPSPPEAPRPQPEWLGEPEPPARGVSERHRTLLELLPTGVLIYRLDRLLYANPAFLRQMRYESLHALEQAGGVDALYVEAGSANGSSTSEAGTPVTISVVEENGDVTASIEARLHTISWDGDSALALMFSPMQSQPVAPVVAEPAPVNPPSAVGHANAEELGAILDTTAEGIVMFDAGGNMHACNRSAEALFGYDGADLARRNLTELFAPESRRLVLDYLESIKGFGVESLLEHGREVLGRVNRGGLIPLSMTMGRTRPDGPNFFAVFRDVSQNRKIETEVQQARRLTETAANAKADLLARISHEMRAPMNAIIGFAEVMISERFGALGNERYVDYMKDIRSSGSRVIATIDDLLELSRIETGKLELAFANQNLNELVESCVAAMQREANRERIIIRTSLAPALPSVVADGRALRQIALNLIGNSIRLANSGGQVIVSTALTDFGEVVLRVRDTGNGLNQGEVAAALEPFRNPPSEQASGTSAVNLSLTKALVEANRAQFHIRTAPQSGTLIEVVFPHALART
ncbi:PAS domain-containing protein [Bradyrhizobium sp.]|uniref:PAS domain-containing sensor histidine kinase n=1 Tax=Bradyrhizobium sp. TaxID=376 RepID=UPI001EB86617|nr:PAS domain-containing protein [Bradyrhizobium sp.]MBV9978735.1 PAS domain S-box protein [Bradyrhizobium sp.]